MTFQSRKRNFLSLSDITTSEISQFMRASINLRAQVFAESVNFSASVVTILENLSVIDIRQSLPFDRLSKARMKSMTMV